MMTDVTKRDGWRYAALRVIYDQTGGNERYSVSFAEVAREIGCPTKEMPAAYQYLLGEGLLASMSMGPQRECTITHSGVVEVEESIRRPAQETEHFTTAVIQHYHGPVGAVQHGENSAVVAQRTGGRACPAATHRGLGPRNSSFAV
jgi:hypothetical protein